MTAVWVLTGVGVVLWAWLIRQVLSRDGYFDRCQCCKGSRCMECIDRDGLTKPKGSRR